MEQEMEEKYHSLAPFSFSLKDVIHKWLKKDKKVGDTFEWIAISPKDGKSRKQKVMVVGDDGSK